MIALPDGFGTAFLVQPDLGYFQLSRSVP